MVQQCELWRVDPRIIMQAADRRCAWRPLLHTLAPAGTHRPHPPVQQHHWQRHQTASTANGVSAMGAGACRTYRVDNLTCSPSLEPAGWCGHCQEQRARLGEHAAIDVMLRTCLTAALRLRNCSAALRAGLLMRCCSFCCCCCSIQAGISGSPAAGKQVELPASDTSSQGYTDV